MENKEKRTSNHLINEKSPYLLYHAYNPVDWHPWCDEAFEKARREDKPVFLSIGYSTCHWCHIMERESFEDDDVAQLLNDGFVCIKVDREERPDIDGVYMAVSQMMTGKGGWPLTIVMTPDKIPFFAATYIPKTNRFGLTGLTELLPRLLDIWEERREDIEIMGEEILFSLSRQSDPAGVELDESILNAAYISLLNQFDDSHGGFGHAPKFPMPHTIGFLLRYYLRFNEKQALAMVESTLRAMRRGGIWDHVGYGFHRYSTDRFWRVPHFEKMLYDQALLAMGYIETFQVTGSEEYKETAEDILCYVLRDMTSPEGAFYSAEDADSEGEEGKFYVWSELEIKKVVKAFDAIQNIFSVTGEGNFNEPGKEQSGKNILYMTKSISELVRELGISGKEIKTLIETERARLFAERAQRVHPFRDDKILADWNGLMIAAFSKAAQVFNIEKYREAAQKAADFILREMVEDILYHRFRDGERAIPGFLDDYAFLVWGLLELYEATFETSYLTHALSLTGYLMDHFWDPRGGFYHTSDGGEYILIRKKDSYDGALPSGNSVALMNLLRLSRITGNTEYEEKAWVLLNGFSLPVSQVPGSHTFFLMALDFALGSTYEVVVVGKKKAQDTGKMIQALQRPFIPNKSILVKSEDDKLLTSLSPFTASLVSIDGKPTCYVCHDHTCNLPTTDIKIMLEQLART